MMVNRLFANTYFGGAGVIGKHLGQPSSMYFPNAVVGGIVGDARERGLDHEPVPTIYYCGLIMQPGLYFLARTHGNPMALGESVRRKLHEIEPARSVLRYLAAYCVPFRRLRRKSPAYRAADVLRAYRHLPGLRGAYTVRSATSSNIRQRELGLRLALGALPGQILRQFVAAGECVLSLLGCLAGARAGGGIFTRVLAGMLFGVSPWDAVTMIGRNRARNRCIHRGVAAAGRPASQGRADAGPSRGITSHSSATTAAAPYTTRSSQLTKQCPSTRQDSSAFGHNNSRRARTPVSRRCAWQNLCKSKPESRGIPDRLAVPATLRTHPCPADSSPAG